MEKITKNTLVDSYQMSEILGMARSEALKLSRNDSYFPKRERSGSGNKFLWVKFEIEDYAKNPAFKERKRKQKQGEETSTLNNKMAQDFIRCGGKHWLYIAKADV